VRVLHADIVELFAGHVVFRRPVVGGSDFSRPVVRHGQVDEFPVGLVLHDAVDVAVAGVVPDALGDEVHGVAVRCLLVVSVRVSAVVPAAAGVAADQAHPQVGVGSADAAFVFGHVLARAVASLA